jgi:hypothetical protein
MVAEKWRYADWQTGLPPIMLNKIQTLPAVAPPIRADLMGHWTFPAWACFLASMWTLSAVADDGPRPDAAQVEFFEAKVRPVLVAHCLECHGPAKQKGGLRLDSAGAMMKGGSGGPAVVPGDSENSPLVEAIGHEGDVRMPPKGKMKDDEVGALTEWVRRGAIWPSEPAALEAPRVAPSREFWAFRPIADPAPPAVGDESWVKSPVDRFVLAQLEARGRKGSSPADRRTIIRRLSFDLTGLPPTPEEVAAFLADELPDAYARLVDRLLSSPHYGERWARHWLDVARYGEDQAHSFQPRLYPQGWRYRDWLIKSLNDNLPYDRFLTEQIAADLIGEDGPDRRDRLAALGFFALGPVYYGDAKKLDQYDDRVDTLTRGVLGLTVACARCHDHKYDPISQRDYYGLAGIIASSEYVEAPIAPPEIVDEYDKAKAVADAKQREVDAAMNAEQLRLKQARMSEVAQYLVAAWLARSTDPKEVARQEGLDPERLRRWSSLLKGATDRPRLKAWSDLNAREGEVCPDEVAILAADIQARVLELNELRVASKLEGPDKVFLDALLANGGPLDTTREKNKVEEDFAPEVREQLKALRAEVKRLEKELPPKYPVVHALKEGKPTTMKILARGNPDDAGEDAPRKFLDVLGGTACEGGSGRLGLALAIASPDNPLTARVMVNRVWQHHFGRGLVATAGNFGQLGERPTHPELLDYLASRFIESGWSLKSLHRLILLSATYQQISDSGEASEDDPENRLLGRANRRRLEVESWRDALLAVSGRLDPTVGGPSFPLTDAKGTRRTIYAAISRHDLAPLLRLFDFPDPNITAPARSQTTVPLQQLIVLNDEMFVASAKALAADLEVLPDDASRIRDAYERLFARPATSEEVEIGTRYLSAEEKDSAPGLTRWQRYAQALLASNEFLYID